MDNAKSAAFPHVVDLTKNFLSVAVSAAEHLRSWLLEQSWFQSVLMPALPRLRCLARCAGYCAGSI